MQISSFIKGYKKKQKLPLPENHDQAIEAANAVQIHSTGARPAFYAVTNNYKNNVSQGWRGAWIKPETYNPKFDTLFKTRLLNRHPNEAEALYNWRLSVYSPVSKELFDKFMVLCKGAILQPNNYTIYGSDTLMEYVRDGHLDEELSELIEFIMQNPIGYIAVIHEGEIEANEAARPDIALIPAEDILMRDHDSIAFKYEGRVYYLNSEIQAEFTPGVDGYIEYVHNIGEVPAWKLESSFTQPYQFWSDLLVRNMNDDEAMTKFYSYPKVQQVESSCPKCQGNRQVVDPLCDSPNPADCLQICSTCNGSGTITNNPGDYITISEETMQRMGGNMPDYARFITPDVGIPKFHMERWQAFYTRVEQSLYLRQATTAAQSGDAKKEDRKDQYYFLQSVSNYVFSNFQKALEYISKYLSPTMAETESVTIIMPKQFDLMSDSDLVNELATLQGKTDDAQTLGEISYMVNSKVFRDDPVQKKISEVLYYADTLYGISGNALRSKYLSGVYTDRDKIVHEKGYKLLLNMSYTSGAETFINTDVATLIQKLDEAVIPLLPQGIYTDVPMGSGEGSGNSLKESVGGLTGMIEIAKAVASGLYDLDAAVALVSDRFGITEEEARKQLGTPQIQNAAELDKVEKLV